MLDGCSVTPTGGKSKLPIREFLQDPTGDVAKLRKLGITDFAIMTYLVRVQEGQAPNQAFDALIAGRSLTEDQKQSIRDVVSRFPGR
jgi:hypothetical protein